MQSQKMSLPLSTLYNSEILSDLIIHLEDHDTKLKLFVHKNILYLGCSYFRSMFNGFSETNSNEITIIVPNVKAASDVIQSFYQGENDSKTESKTNWKYELNLYQCKDFFGLEVEFPRDMIVDSGEFEKLLDFVGRIGINSNIAKLLVRNVPENYALSEFIDLIKDIDCYDEDISRLIIRRIPTSFNFDTLPKKLIQKFWNIVDLYYILLIDYYSIKIINCEGKIYRTISCAKKIRNVCYIADGHKIAYHTNKYLYVYDIRIG